MKPPTQDEITNEIAKLREIKPNVTRKSMFGDNHHDSIDAQIAVMVENLSESKIYDRSTDGTDDETNEDKWKDNVKDSALEARRWMDGDQDNSPSKDWEPLLQNRPAPSAESAPKKKKGKK